MRLAVGEAVSLGRQQYRIRSLLGGGAVADAYLATPEATPSVEVVIKLARTEGEGGATRAGGVEQEARVLAVLNQAEDRDWPPAGGFAPAVQRMQATVHQRRVITLLDSGELEPGQPFVVQEKAPGAFERFPIETLADERRMWAVLQAVAGVVVLTHQCDLALRDFDPRGYKEDRLRVRWLDEARAEFELKVIDWNITGGPASADPQAEDQQQDLFYLGQHMYYFLVGRRLALEGDQLPPGNLGLGAPAWEKLTAGSRQILSRALHRSTARRYQTAVDLERDITWWLEALQQASENNALGRLDDRLWQAKTQARHDRVLAVADLGLRLTPPAETRQSFEALQRQARDELEKENWVPLAMARGTLGTGNFARAAEEFAKILRDLPVDSEAARLARLFRLQAQTADALKKSTSSEDIRSSPEFEILARAASALVKRAWAEAQAAMLELTRAQPEAATWPAAQELLALAQAGVLVNQATVDLAATETRPADAGRSDWLNWEAGLVQSMEQVVEGFAEAQRLAPLEPEYRDLAQVNQMHLQRRRALLVRYRDLEQFAAQGDELLRRAQQAEAVDNAAVAAGEFSQAAELYRAALGEAQAILELEPAQPRATRRQRELRGLEQQANQSSATHAAKAELGQQIASLQAEVTERIDEGHYAAARSVAEMLGRLSHADQHRTLLGLAQAGEQLEKQAAGFLLNGQRNLDQVGPEELSGAVLVRAKQQAELALLNRSLGDAPAGSALAPELAGRPFRYTDDHRQQVNKLLQAVALRFELYPQIRAAREQGDFQGEIMLLEQVGRSAPPLTAAERVRLDEARGRRQSALADQLQVETATQALEAGAYPRVIELLMPLVAREAGRQDWRDLLTVARRGQAQVELSRRLLAEARQAWLDRRLEKARQHLDQLGEWDGALFDKLGHEAPLPPEALQRRFILPVEIRTARQDLLERTEQAAKLVRSREAAGASGEHEKVLDDLEQLAALVGGDLTPAERDGQAEAQHRLRQLKLAEAQLAEERPQSFEDLALTLGLLQGDPGRRAAGLVEKIANRWLLQTESLLAEPTPALDADQLAEKLDQVAAYLQQGLGLFNETSVGAVFTERSLLSRYAGEVMVALRQSADRPDDGDDTWPRLAGHLEALQGKASWPSLRRLATVWRGQWVAVMERQGRARLAETRAQLRRWNPADEPLVGQALLDRLHAFRLAAQAGWNELPWDVQEGLQLLTGELELRLKVEAALVALARQTVVRKADLEAIPLPPETAGEVPWDDLKALLADLEQVAAVEDALRQPVTEDGQAQAIWERRRLGQLALSALQQVRGQRDQEHPLVSQARDSAERLTMELRQSLKAEVEWLNQLDRLNRLDPDTPLRLDRLLRLYWQGQWLKATLTGELVELSEARRSPLQLFLAAAKILTEMRSSLELRRTQVILAAALELDLSLSTRPAEGPLGVSLPSLAAGQVLEVTKPQLPEAAQSAREAVAYLVNLDQAGQAAAPAPAAVDRKVLEQLPNHLAALLNAITNLWPGRERLRPDGTLERLQQEVEWHTALFQAVEEARAQKATDPLAGLRTLQVKVEQAELWAKLDAAPLWLLHGQRLALRQAYHQVRQALADALSDWIEQLLANSATAPSELDRLLHTLRDARLAQSVYQAIGDGIRKRASRSTPGPDQPASAASDLVPRSASPAPPLGRRGERAAPLGRAKPAAQRPSDKPASRK